ncbi:MAG TPA: hypothetical protein VK386_00325 [Acidimicrobiales bacterium]|nr:hypothetical protein [Acidimicrobiales bacterium]
MAVRGSGIGASIAAGGLAGTNNVKTPMQGAYGMGVQPTGSRAKTHVVLVALVLVEMALLLWLRHAFRDHQGG